MPPSTAGTAGDDGLSDLAEETEEPVLGRATMKWQSKHIVEKGVPVYRGRARSGGINLPQPTMPSRGQYTGQKSRWELTPDLMTQPWGELVRRDGHLRAGRGRNPGP
jgi:hypothetical protein